MSDLEKDLENVDEVQIDTGLDGFGNIQEFVDFEDLSELSAENVLADMEALGDVSDLGDLSDISEWPEDDDLPELDDIPLEETLETAESELDASDLLAGLMPDSDVESLAELDMEELEAELNVADLFQTVEPEPMEEEPEFLAEDISLPDELDISADLMNDLEEAAGMVDAIPIPDEADLSIDSLMEPVISEDIMTEPVIPKNIGEEESLDDMLDGLLDDLDANGSLGGVQPMDLEEEMKEETPEEEGGLDDLLNLLTSGDEEVEAQEDIIGLEDMFTEEAQEDLIPEMIEEEAEKPGLMKRLFGNVVTDEIAQKELADREAEKEAEAQREEEAAKAKEEAEAAKALKAEEKAAKKAAKAEEKALKKAAKAEEKAAKKAEREARKAEEEAAAELEVVGKLNRVGVSIIVVLTVLFLAAEISGTKIFSYRSTLNQAKDYFEMQRYTQAYQEILGTDIKEKDQETYDKIVTVMKVQRSLNSYANYDSMKYYPDALNALLRGIEKYDENIETGRNLEVEKDMDSCREQILSILQEEYGLSESEAYDILSMEKEAYTEKVVEIGMNSK